MKDLIQFSRLLQRPVVKSTQLAEYVKFVVRGSKNASQGSLYDFLRFHGAETMNRATDDGYHCAKVALRVGHALPE